MNRISVTVGGETYALFAGAEVWMLIDQLPPDDQLAIKNGTACLVDRFGNQVGLGGALSDGQVLAVRQQA